MTGWASAQRWTIRPRPPVSSQPCSWPKRCPPSLAASPSTGSLSSRPGWLAVRAGSARLGGLAGELARIGSGRSRLEPEPKDRRFLDPAWRSNPLLHRILQAHLAAAGTLDGLVDDADLDERMNERIMLLAANLIAAVAPSNVAVLNPAALKAGLDSGGLSFDWGRLISLLSLRLICS